MLRYFLQVALLAIVATYAWRRGGWPERAAAAALVAMLAIDRAYHLLVQAPQYRQFDLWHMSLDIALLAALIVLALRAPRVWLLWLASFQLISTLGHILHALGVTMPVVIYWLMTAASSYFQILLLAVGTYLNDRKRWIRPTT